MEGRKNGGREEGERELNESLGAKRRAGSEDYFPQVATAQAAASKRGSDPKGESGIRPGEGDPGWACCNQAGFPLQVREGTSGNAPLPE